MVAVTAEVTLVVVTGKVAVLVPVANDTLLGTITAELSLLSDTLIADPWTVLVVTVPVLEEPPITVPGLTETELRVGYGTVYTSRVAD